MIVVSNRVEIPAERVDTFVERLRNSHGIEEAAGFRGMKLLAPLDADGHVTLTFWESVEAYEAWRDGSAFERAHGDRTADETFDRPNDVELHEVVVERSPAKAASE